MSFRNRLASFLSVAFAVAALAIVPVQHAVAQDQAASGAAPAAAASSDTAAAPAATPVPPPPVAMSSKESVDNPYGLQALWAQGDFVAKGVLILLVLMSMGSWYIMITKLYESLKMSGEARAAGKSFFKSPNLGTAVKSLKEGSAFRYIAETAVSASEHHEGELTENIDRNSWVTMSVQRTLDDVQSRLQDGLSFLATVGSTAPFVGLFGTVWGIYNALTAIGIAGQASIDKVAGPVGEALIMTAIGLAVAVPAVLGYNWLVRRNKVTMEKVRSFGADLHGVLLGAAMGAQTAGNR
ncbi:MAG: MotA/TolQ/ExbB proton channel family protein [Proteobacteria bacterium]|nr:MotA/TolQ/ExbB proton channel family protein [Pseudomonadota bacterium]